MTGSVPAAVAAAALGSGLATGQSLPSAAGFRFVGGVGVARHDLDAGTIGAAASISLLAEGIN